MLSNIGIPGLIIILVLALIIFGPSKLPEIGRAFGRSLREFKDATKDIAEQEPKAEAGNPRAEAGNQADSHAAAGLQQQEPAHVSATQTHKQN